MNEDIKRVSQAEQYLLEKIRIGNAKAWSEFVDRYRGRLLSFARSRLLQPEDAEDAVQETFVAFIKNLKDYRAECGLETYLFSLLRFKVIDNYRSQKARHYCLIQDTYNSGFKEKPLDPLETMAGPAQTASWYCRADENYNIQKEALTNALSEMVNGFKAALNFRDLQITELLFYCCLSNKDIAKIMGVKDSNIALFKHRCIKQIRGRISGSHLNSDSWTSEFENLLTDIWKLQRFSCLKRSTIGAYILGTLESDWSKYVGFHLNTLGCGFCLANLEDIKLQNRENQNHRLRSRIMESTAGFLNKPV